MTSCETEIDEPFKEEELQRANVYSKGDQFSMVANYGDTLTFTVEDKTLEKRGGGVFTDSYQQLIYRLSINNSQFGGEIYVKSLPNSENELIYEIDITENKHIDGGTDLSMTTDTVVINGITYPNANCNETSCLSNKNGYLRFNEYNDTLTLLP
jgi:hypothetical protein